jgi:hypothetical protein
MTLPPRYKLTDWIPAQLPPDEARSLETLLTMLDEP